MFILWNIIIEKFNGFKKYMFCNKYTDRSLKIFSFWILLPDFCFVRGKRVSPPYEVYFTTNRPPQSNFKILKTLENNPNSQKIAAIEDDLPLFAALKQDIKEQKPTSPLMDALEKLNPDNLTPREALDKIYELKLLYQDTFKNFE